MPAAPPAPARSQAPVFTELDARRLGPVRRYFARHPRAMDWIVVAWFGVPGVLWAMASADRWILLPLAVLTATALLWRRTAPLWTAGAVGLLSVCSLVLSGDTGGGELAVALAVYAVAASRPPVVAWSTASALVVVLSLAVLARMSIVVTDTGEVVHDAAPAGTPTGDRIATIVVLVVFVLVALAIGTSVRGRRLHLADLLDRANALARDRDQQAQLAVAAERTRIAREMHDVVAHSLTVMVALADGAKASGRKDPELAGHALDELTETGRAALADMRRVLGVLREPTAGPEVPLEPADTGIELEDIVERFRTTGLPVRLVRRGERAALDPSMRQAVHRIVSESLTNVLRYAPTASQVVVEVVHRDDTASGEGDWLDVRVTNWGGRAGTPAAPAVPGVPGVPVPPGAQGAGQLSGVPIGTGRGIIGMRERASVHGGTVTAGPTATGWEVRATMRLDQDAR